MSELLADMIFAAAARRRDAPALVSGEETIGYGALADLVAGVAGGLVRLGVGRGERVAVYLEKRPETVATMFGAAAAGAAFVPLNPLLRQRQVAHILNDCGVRVLVTSAARLATLGETLAGCPALGTVVLVDGAPDGAAIPDPVELATWPSLSAGGAAPSHRVIDTDMTAILYTSGSTGLPKGVVLSHRNLVAGARSVSAYLENTPEDRILCVLPLSFDAGFSQLSTAFCAGACAVLMDYLLPKDVVTQVARHRITGLAGVPPLWMQLAEARWPDEAAASIRYFTNTGGHMPRSTLDRLRALLPGARPYLMYGLTEAFRSTYLPPSEIDRRPDSMGKAVPNAEILVVGDDGTLCGPGESGELVHRGPLVSLGYWNDPERTDERFRPLPASLRAAGLCLEEIAVWSGDTVRMDEDGYLYFVGRRDDMIKSSGYRISPTEIEEVVVNSGLVGEAVAFGAPHPRLGQGIVVVATPPAGGSVDGEAIIAACRAELPPYMVPQLVVERPALARNANGKIDRPALSRELADIFEEAG